jgi:hypothetical protein
MDNLKEKLKIEFANLDLILNELPPFDRLCSLSILELAGVSTLIHNFYNGIENVLKLTLNSCQIPLPTGSSWHKELLNLALEKHLISTATRNALGEYLAFRHFFIHAYALDLYPEKMEPLVAKCEAVYWIFKHEIQEFIVTI